MNISTDKIEMGHRTEAGWIVDVQTPAQVKPDTDYNLLLSINGTVATLVIDGAQAFSFAFMPSVDIYGVTHGLNRGMVGLGAQNSSARIDDLAVQILPPQLTLDETETFSDGRADRFTDFTSGVWQVANGLYTGAPVAGSIRALSLFDVDVGPSYLLKFGATINTGKLAGIVFDQYAADDFKFAAISVETQEVVLGHYTARGGWKTDASLARTIVAGQNYRLEVSLKGTTTSVSLDGQAVLGFVYNALTVDGGYGLFTERAASSFDTVTMMTNDLAYDDSLPGGAPVAVDDIFTTSEDVALVITIAQLLPTTATPMARR